MDNFRNTDAILDLSNPDDPKEPEWPVADFIVGNPPFLGGSRMWKELGREYQEKLWFVYEGRIPGFSDLVCYWFEKARKQIVDGNCKRAGLLATQAIRGGVNREVLKRIKESGNIFFAMSDLPWILDGASVHISMIAFDDGREQEITLDGKRVASINSNPSSTADTTQARPSKENAELSFRGTQKSGDFNVAESQALGWLPLPNPNGKPNSDVLRPWLNGGTIVKRNAPFWIIDTGIDMTMEQFSLYEAPFRHVLNVVKPERDKNKRDFRREHWWLHAETAPGMRRATKNLRRYIATPRVSKYRIFVWVSTLVLCDDGIYVFAHDDDYFFGVLHSRVHEIWARAQGTQVRERESGFRYTSTTCFETFPFPIPSTDQEAEIARVANELDTLRNAWLVPPEWVRQEILEFSGSVEGPWANYVQEPDERGIGSVRYTRLVPKDDAPADLLAKRTLTNLYNERPTWLDLAHKRLDEAVLAAYGWDSNVSDEDILSRLLSLNQQRSKSTLRQ